jgi:hypothetical protein
MVAHLPAATNRRADDDGDIVRSDVCFRGGGTRVR